MSNIHCTLVISVTQGGADLARAYFSEHIMLSTHWSGDMNPFLPGHCSDSLVHQQGLAGLEALQAHPFSSLNASHSKNTQQNKNLETFPPGNPPPLKKTLRALSTVVETVFDICIRRIWPKYGNIKCTCSLLLRGSSCFAEKQDIKQHLKGRQANHFKY